MTDNIPTVDIGSLRRAIAHSLIIVAALAPPRDSAPPRDFAEWCERHRADIDVVVSDWLRSEVRHRDLH